MKLDYTPHNMSDIEVKIVTKLFEMFEEEGWAPKKVDDGVTTTSLLLPGVRRSRLLTPWSGLLCSLRMGYRPEGLS